MQHGNLTVSYRKGKPFAAYYKWPHRSGDHSTRTKELPDGILVDFAPDGRAIGIEITSPALFDLTRLNESLVLLGLEPVLAQEFAPLLAG